MNLCNINRDYKKILCLAVPNRDMMRMHAIVNTIDKETVAEWFDSKMKWVRRLLAKKCTSMRLDIITGIFSPVLFVKF